MSITVAIAPAPPDQPGKLFRAGETTIRGSSVRMK